MCILRFWTLLGALAILAACRVVSAPQSPEKTLPPQGMSDPAIKNIILVSIDTLRADYLGFQGGAARTPTIDKLAGEGWAFTSTYATSMLTNPAHASIMTSLYPQDHGVYTNESGIADGLPTLASLLQKQGLATGAVIGFPHLNPEVSNLGQGFSEVVRSKFEERRAPQTSAEGLALIDKLAGGQKGKENGFFAWLHYTDPHAPYEPPSSHPPRHSSTHSPALYKAFEQAPGFQLNNPWFDFARKKYQTVDDLVQRYIAEIEATDAGLSMLLAGLEERGLLETTALVLTSDHGENMGEHGLYFHHGGLYRETVHVPLIFWAKGLQSSRVDGLVSTVDIVPTLLDLRGVKADVPMRGESLCALVKGKRNAREFVFYEHMEAQLVGVRNDEGSLIVHQKGSHQFPAYPFVPGHKEFYDVANDPAESLALTPRGLLAERLGSALDGYRAQGMKLSSRVPLEQDRESLKALGYLD